MGAPFKPSKQINVAVRLTIAEWGAIADTLDLIGSAAFAVKIRLQAQKEFGRIRATRKARARK